MELCLQRGEEGLGHRVDTQQIPVSPIERVISFCAAYLVIWAEAY